jgi:hypothetical protein
MCTGKEYKSAKTNRATKLLGLYVGAWELLPGDLATGLARDCIPFFEGGDEQVWFQLVRLARFGDV